MCPVRTTRPQGITDTHRPCHTNSRDGISLFSQPLTSTRSAPRRAPTSRLTPRPMRRPRSMQERARTTRRAARAVPATTRREVLSRIRTFPYGVADASRPRGAPLPMSPRRASYHAVTACRTHFDPRHHPSRTQPSPTRGNAPMATSDKPYEMSDMTRQSIPSPVRAHQSPPSFRVPIPCAALTARTNSASVRRRSPRCLASSATHSRFHKRPVFRLTTRQCLARTQ